MCSNRAIAKVKMRHIASVAVAFLLLLMQQALAADVVSHRWLDDGNEQARPLPVNLGTDVHQCWGDIKKCSAGFTFDFWFKPDVGDHRIRHRYVVSSGGQSAMSEGFYIRQNYGKEYEIGVSNGGVSWRVSTELALDGSLQLALTWDETHGLDVYVDGIVAGTDGKGHDRVFTNPMYDPFPNILLGKANDDISGKSVKDLAIWNVTFSEERFTQETIAERIGSGHYTRGCLAQMPSELSADDFENGDTTYNCRQRCAVQGAAVFNADSKCACLSKKALDKATPVACTQKASSQLLRTTHAQVPSEYPIGLAMRVIKPTRHEYVRPNETLTFVATTDGADEQVIFYINFGDGESRVTTDERVSHEWSHEGVYTVNTTAVTRVAREEVLTDVEIQWVEEGIPPELVDIESNILAESRQVMFYITAISKYAKTCVLDTGDNNVMRFIEEDAVIFIKEVKYVYATIGHYDIHLNCSNAYGHKSVKEHVIASHPLVEYAFQSIKENVVVNVIGAQTLGWLVVSLDEINTLNYAVVSDSITIPSDVFTYVGEHIVYLSTLDGMPVFTKVFNLQTPIRAIHTSASPQHTQVNHSVELSFSIEGDSPMHVWLRYGDGEEEYLYFVNESAPISISRTHRYASLGIKLVEITAANDLGMQYATQMVSIERPIKDVTFTGEGVVRLGDACLFTFEVDPTVLPAMPIRVEFDYHDDLENEIVDLGEMSDKVITYTHTYTFKDYGWYDVWAKVCNNISCVNVSVILQVGQDIDYVDVYTDKQRAVVGDEVTITIHSPRGSPMKLAVDMGDGESMVFYVPKTSEDRWFSDRIEKRPAAADDTESSKQQNDDLGTENKEMKNTDVNDVDGKDTKLSKDSNEDNVKEADEDAAQEENARRRRAAPERVKIDDNTNITVTTVATVVTIGDLVTIGEGMPDKSDQVRPKENVIEKEEENKEKNKDFVFNYKYKNAGQFLISVVVTNQFSERRTQYCPEIVIINKDVPVPDCDRLEVNIAGATIENQPLVVQRSNSSDLQTFGIVSCQGGAAGMVYEPCYVWHAERKTASGEWRPELNVCQTQSKFNMFTVESHTLWYGLYRLSAVASVCDTVVQSSPAVTYLRITPSPLVAQIDSKKDVSRFWPLTINMHNSHDPDVKTGNTTGMMFHLFCYAKSIAQLVQEKPLEQMLQDAVHVANNSADNVRIYGYESCFQDTSRIWVLNYEFVIPADDLLQNDSLIFQLFVEKDDRTATVTHEVKIWPTNMTGNDVNAIDALLASGDVGAALMVMSDFTSSLNAENDGNDTSASNERTKLRSKVINLLGRAVGQASTFDQASKASKVLSDVTVVKKEVTGNAKKSAASALGTVGERAAGMASDANLDQVSGMGGNVMAAAGNVLPFDEASAEDDSDDTGTPDASSLNATNPTKKKEEEEEEPVIPCCQRIPAGMCEWIPNGFVCVNETVMDMLDEVEWKEDVWTDELCEEVQPDDLIIQVDYYNCYRELKKNESYAEKETAMPAWNATESMGGLMQSKMTEGDESLSMNAGPITVKLRNLGTKESRRRAKRRRRALGEEEPDGVSDLMLELAGDGGGLQEFNSPNMRTYSDSAKDVKSKVKTLNLADKTGVPLVVKDTATPITINIPVDQARKPVSAQFVFVTNSSQVPNMNYHSVPVPKDNRAIVFTLTPLSEHDCYDVFMAYDIFPNDTYYDWKVVVPREERLLGADSYTAELLRNTVTVPANLTTRKGSYRIGIKLCDSVKADNSTYEYSHMVTGCLFWSDEAKNWLTDGCEVGPLTTFEKTACLCNHLTSFGGDMVVPPNTIDFNTVFSLENFLESMPVFCTVIIIILIYIGFLVWGRREDKKDLIKWGATPLEDNLPTDEYHYQITINTGTKKNSGTKSKISFILSGDDGDTGVRRLYDGKRKEHPKGSILNYVLSTEACLGPLTFLRIWHDNKGPGKSKSWFLGQVQLMDLQTGEKFFFLCDRWLAVEEDDGAVERILPVAGLDDLTAFNHLFNSSVRKKLTNDHMWVSVLSRPTRSNFTRVQRVSCCVSLLFLTMITNCMFFKADDKAAKVSAINIGPFSFTLSQLFISVVTTAIVFPPSLAIVMIFRKARPKRNTVMQENQQRSKKFRWRSTQGGSSLWTNVRKTRTQRLKETIRNIVTFHQKAKYETEDDGTQQERPKKKSKGFTLPYWTMYIAWTLVFFSVVASGFFTILYSMEWGRKKSLDWLSTFLLSFFQSVIVVQPVKVLLFAAFVSCVLRKPDLDEDEENFDDINIGGSSGTATGSQRDLQEIVQQRKMAASQVAPPDTEALAEAREVRMKEIQMEAILKECLVYFFFLMVLFFLSYQARDPDSFLFAQNIKNTFIETSTPFENIKTPNVFWAWVHGILMPNLYSSAWYNGKRLTWNEALQIDDRNTIRVGVARFRQLRIKEDSCKIQSVFGTIINHCHENYNWVDDDTRDFWPGWKLPEEPGANSTKPKQEVKRNKRSSWIYRNTLETKTAPYSGTITMYKGGGYTFNFRRSPRRTTQLLKELEKLEWVNPRSRAIFVEFTLYNANVNLFASVIMLVEFIATGAAVTRTEVKVFRLSSYVGGFGVIVIMFELIYLVFTLYFFVQMIKQLRKERLRYFKDFWNMLEFATLVMSIVTIAMYAMKKIFGTVAMNILHESESGDYVNFVTISIWDETFGFVLACVVFVSTVKFVKMLRFNRRMSMLGDTIQLATKDLKIFSITFFIYYFAFCMMAYLLFGKLLPSYGTFVGTIEALFAFALGDFDFYSMQDAHSFMGPLFFIMYVAIVYIGLMGMFLTIIADSFTQVKANSDLQSNEYEIVDFMTKKLRGIFGWS